MSAAPRVGIGEGDDPPVAEVPSHWWSAVSDPSVKWNVRTSVVTGPSNKVEVGPSIRSSTGTGAPNDGDGTASTAVVRPPSRRPRLRRCIISHPFPRGRMCLAGRRQVSWLPGLPSAPSRCLVGSGGLRNARAAGVTRSQWRVRVGFAPTSLHHRPMNASEDSAATPDGGSAPRSGIVGGMTVNLTRIYTKLGDGGETHLGDMSRVPKTHPRIEAYGEIDELNAQIGVTLATTELSGAVLDVSPADPERPVRPRR